MSRRRYVYRECPDTGEVEAIEVSADWQPSGRANGGVPVTDLYMDGTRAMDGTDIGSRSKRREYMHVRGLADYDDFKGVWAKAEAERTAMRLDGVEFDAKARREAVARAFHEANERKRHG